MMKQKRFFHCPGDWCCSFADLRTRRGRKFSASEGEHKAAHLLYDGECIVRKLHSRRQSHQNSAISRTVRGCACCIDVGELRRAVLGRNRHDGGKDRR